MTTRGAANPPRVGLRRPPCGERARYEEHANQIGRNHSAQPCAGPGPWGLPRPEAPSPSSDHARKVSRPRGDRFKKIKRQQGCHARAAAANEARRLSQGQIPIGFPAALRRRKAKTWRACQPKHRDHAIDRGPRSRRCAGAPSPNSPVGADGARPFRRADLTIAAALGPRSGGSPARGGDLVARALASFGFIPVPEWPEAA